MYTYSLKKVEPNMLDDTSNIRKEIIQRYFLAKPIVLYDNR